MAPAQKIQAGPRQRRLAILGIAALAAVILAVVALGFQSVRNTTENETPEFLADFTSKAQQATKIQIESRSNKFAVDFKPQKGWVLPDSGDYPASVEHVRQTLLGLAGLKIVEAKTARADWLPYLGLDAPPKGAGTAISVFNDKGEVLASLILGKTTDIGDKSGATGLFVRRPGTHESWLARSTFTPQSKPIDWMEKSVVALGRDRIKSVDVDPEGSSSFTISRDAKDRPEFAVTPLPPGRELASPVAPYGVADAIADFSFEDIRPAAEIEFGKASRMVFRTFDGLMVSVLTVRQGGDFWATVEASTVPGTHDAKKEARHIGAHTSGWAYKLTAQKGAQFMPTLESLLKPKAAK